VICIQALESFSKFQRSLGDLGNPEKLIQNYHLHYLWKSTVEVLLIFISCIGKVQVNLISELSGNAALSLVNSVRYSLASWESTYI